MRRILAATVALLGLFLLSWLVCTALGVLTPDARAFDRFVTPAEAARFAGWLDRYGPAAIVTSRPVPMMAETLSCLAGLGGMRLPRFLLALLLGTAPYAWFFAWAGDRLGRVREKPGLALLVALAVPALYWIGFAVLAGRRKGRE
ncbi:MAG: DedA family protein [Planctomycetota bacterium]|jgi:membrane protein DedA with SNARE-associated domain